MNNPAGLAVDSLSRLWVAEEDFQPKRVSLWDADGRLLLAYRCNKASGITADVPSEAELAPRLWGFWEFKTK